MEQQYSDILDIPWEGPKRTRPLGDELRTEGERDDPESKRRRILGSESAVVPREVEVHQAVCDDEGRGELLRTRSIWLCEEDMCSSSDSEDSGEWTVYRRDDPTSHYPSDLTEAQWICYWKEHGYDIQPQFAIARQILNSPYKGGL